jgi:hypothetical protein
VRRAALALLALALTGCETTAEKSAKLERVAKQLQASEAAKNGPAKRGLSITKQSKSVQVLAASVLHSPEGNAVVLTLRNTSARSLSDIPIAITAYDARGAAIYTNSEPGLNTALVSAPVVRAHATMFWIDDQIGTATTPASVRAKVGEGTPTGAGAVPRLTVEGARLSEATAGGGAVEGSVVNHSPLAQREVLVNALARRGGKILAAGRAVLPQVAGAGAAMHFQLYLIGDPRGARLEFSASPRISSG